MSQLINLMVSMTKMEKRHFVSAQKKLPSPSHIYQLYIEVDKNLVYDELHLKKIFKNSSFVTILPTIKNQLYNALLRDLREFHGKSNIDIIIRNEMTEIDILIKKQLYTEALKKINQLKKPIEKYERFTYSLELILRETELKYFTQKNKEFSEEITRSIVLSRDVGRKFYSFAYQKLMLFRMQSMMANDRDLSIIKYNPLEEKHLSTIQSATYYNLHNSLLYCLKTEDYSKALDFSKELLDIMNANPHEFEDNPEQKVDVWYACGLAYIYSKKVPELRLIVKEITALKVQNPRIEIRRDERILDLKLLDVLVNSNKKDNQDLEKFMGQIKKNSKRFSHYFIQKTWNTIANIYLLKNDYKKVLSTNYNLLIFQKQYRAKYYHKRAVLREVFIYFELGKSIVYESRIKSIYRTDLGLTTLEKKLLKKLNSGEGSEEFKKYLLT